MRARVVTAVVLLLASARCAATPPPAAIHPAPLPDDARAQELALGQIGRQLYRALGEGVPERLLVDASELKSMLDTDGAMRVLELRRRGSAPGIAAKEMRAAFSGTSYDGVCFDRARREAAGTTLGLLHEAFVFERALIVGKQVGGTTLAAWMEGLFMSTGTGDLAVALVLSRVEAPRRDHPDLGLLQCDFKDGLDGLRPIVGPASPAP